ncbi:hypothetical protein [Streptomyces sp. NPDC088789]|uniref:hypothetical protein n=1 Tax=Streptomyces sp. NPDC088789 TaxID=3365899 RepID=UPI003807FE7A
MPTHQIENAILSERAPVAVRVTGEGLTAVMEIDGHDVSREVVAYSLTHRAGGVPQMVVELSEHSTAGGVFDGLAHVAIGEPPDPGPVAAAFLSVISAAELEKVALTRHDLLDGRPHELTRAMLAVLHEWALGQWHMAEPRGGD